MSVGYAEIIFPSSNFFNVDPDPQQIRGVLNELLSLGWVRDVREDGLYKRLESAHRIVDAWEPLKPLRLWLAGGGQTGSEEWPEGQSIFNPQFCEDVEIVCGPDLLLFPSGMNGATMPCGSCGDDLVSQPWRRYELAYSQNPEADLPQYMFHDYLLAPTQCLGCDMPPRYQELVFKGDRTIPCAAFKFVIRCAAARGPSTEDVKLDPGTLARLSAACGVPLRSAGVFE